MSAVAELRNPSLSLMCLIVRCGGGRGFYRRCGMGVLGAAKGRREPGCVISPQWGGSGRIETSAPSSSIFFAKLAKSYKDRRRSWAWISAGV